jgi:NAD(P)-dependent dehydrogenase (short-subunit alcohol dehydrogenase family)
LRNSKKTILITGATGYFGIAFVNELSKSFHVIAMSRNLEKLNSTFPSSEITKVACDLYNAEELKNCLEKVCKSNDIHGLLHNAYDLSERTGFNTPKGRLENMPIEVMQASFNSGLLASLICAQVLGTQMAEKKIAGSLVFISSMYGNVAPDFKLYEGKNTFNPITYGMAKAGVQSMARYMASYWGHLGIRANCIAPGAFPNTGFKSKQETPNATQDTEFLQRLVDKTAAKRFGDPKDLMGAAKLLLSDESSYINGQTISIDGGWCIT